MPTHIKLDPLDPTSITLSLYDEGSCITALTPCVTVRIPTDLPHLRNLGGGMVDDPGRWLYTVLCAVAQASFVTGRASAGADMSEVILTPPVYTNPRAPGEWLGASALLHYSDDDDKTLCGLGPRVAGYTGAANVLAAIFDGAAPCPECNALHRESYRFQADARAAVEDKPEPVEDPQLPLPKVD